MKNKSIEISIPEPCHENWDEMTPSEKGRFCSNCERTIIDFSTKSNQEIANAYRKSKGKLCGRFSTTQLSRDISLEERKFQNLRLKTTALLFSGILASSSASGQDFSEPPSESIELHDQKLDSIKWEVVSSFTFEQNPRRDTVDYGCAEFVEFTEEAKYKALGYNNFNFSIPEPTKYIYGTLLDNPFMAFSFQGYPYVTDEKGKFQLPVDPTQRQLLYIGHDWVEPLILDISKCNSEDDLKIKLIPSFIKVMTLGFASIAVNSDHYSQKDIDALIKKETETEEDFPLVPYRLKNHPLLQVNKNPTLFFPKHIRTIFPTSFKKQINVALHSTKKQSLCFELRNKQGEIIHQQEESLSNGINVATLDLANEPKPHGQYLLSIYQDDNILHRVLLSAKSSNSLH